MARFRPFRGIRYEADRIGSMDEVVAPPYDVINNKERDALYDCNAFNVARLILNREGHDAAADLYRSWLADGSIRHDDGPCFYVYAQEFDSEGPRRRVGVIGALHIEPFSAGVVLPHETTFAHHKEDRLALTRRAKANLSPIFGTFSNPEFSPVPSGGWDSPADIDVTHADVRHRLWAVSDEKTVAEIQAAVAGRSVFIADGHHRYETALNYYRELHDGQDPPAGDDAPADDEAPEAHVMAFLAAFEDPGMLILPTHRALKHSGGADHAAFEAAVSEAFHVRTFERNEQGRSELLGALLSIDAGENGFGVALGGLDHYLLLSRSINEQARKQSPLSELDVKILHQRLLDGALVGAGATDIELGYSVDAEGLLAQVEAGEIEGVFLLNATRAEDMAAVCLAGELMPQKSTYFYPKLLTGLTFHALRRG